MFVVGMVGSICSRNGGVFIHLGPVCSVIDIPLYKLLENVRSLAGWNGRVGRKCFKKTNGNLHGTRF